MELYYGNLYWYKTKKRESKFSELDKNIKTEVLVVGGGMSGNLCANKLSKAGLEVTLIEKNRIGMGSSAANAGLLQYSSDIMMHELAKSIGEENAYYFYKMCLDAINDFERIDAELLDETDFRKRDNIYYSSDVSDKGKLKKEFELLKKYNFPVEYLDKDDLKTQYNINKPNALGTLNDADINPYKFILALVNENLRNGVKYYENTDHNIDTINNNSIKTQKGYKVEYKQIIFATGYGHIYPEIRGKFEMYRTYAFCSKPIEGFIWKDGVMLWETKNPYLYYRTTKDNRIIAGGLDKKSTRVEKNKNDVDIENNKLVKEIEKIFPHLKIDIEFSWDGLFAGAKDGIPFIGRSPDNPNVYFLLGYGGNGTVYSMAGSNIIRDLIIGHENPYADIVRLDR